MKKKDKKTIVKEFAAKILHDEGSRYHERVRPTKDRYNRQKAKKVELSDYE